MKRALDSEADGFNLEIIAFDGTHSTSVPVTIKIKAIPASKGATCPEAISNLTIAGNLPSGHVIANLPSSTKSEVVFNHLLGAERLPFEIQNGSQLVVKDSYANTRSYSIKLKSRKEHKFPIVNAEPSCLQKIGIFVKNANRFTPKFESSTYNLTVKEDVPVSEEQGFFLLQVQADDEDFDDYGKIQYSLVNSTDKNGMFAVNKDTGAVILRKPLDRESEDGYELFVKAADGGGLNDFGSFLSCFVSMLKFRFFFQLKLASKSTMSMTIHPHLRRPSIV